MIRFLTISLLIISTIFLLTGITSAEMFINGDQPDTSFHFSGKLDLIHIIDSFALASLEQDLLILKLNNASGVFEDISNVSLGTDVLAIKTYDSVAAILTAVDIIFFVDISSLPEMKILGQADLPTQFYDFALNGQDLFIASGFNGLQRFQLTDFNSPVFMDSSMIGVHSVRVDVYGDELLVLDDYNGILRYDLSGGGLGTFDKYLYIPRQANSFVRSGSSLLISLASSFKLYIASSDSLENGITDSLGLLVQADDLISYNEYLIAMNYGNHQIEIVKPAELSHLTLILPESFYLSPGGSVVKWDNKDWLVLSSDSSGSIRYNLTDLLTDRLPRSAYIRPGEITSLVFHNEKLITGGYSSYLESFSFDSLGLPAPSNSMNILLDISAIEIAKDILLVLYPSINSILGIRNSSDAFEIDFSIPIDGSSVQSLHYEDISPNDTLDGLFIIKDTEVDIYTVSEKWDVRPASVARTLAHIDKLVIVDTLLLLSTSNNLIHGFRIYNDYSVASLWTVAAFGQVDELIATGSRQDSSGQSLPEMIIAFIDRDMYQLDISNPSIPSTVYLEPIDSDVKASVIIPNTGVFTVGDFGIGWLDLKSATPAFTSWGGKPGDIITFDTTLSILATSNGKKINLYKINPLTTTANAFIDREIIQHNILGVNYPNPFNPSTTIEYTLPHETRVKLVVLDLMGRTVANLVNNLLPSGIHRTAWTGRDKNGNRVASGIYFYRLTTPTASETRKMILIK